MAEIAQIFVSPLLRALFGNLTESAIQEIKSIWGVEEEVEKLQSTVIVIQDVVEDAEEKQFHSKAVQNWLRKLKDVAYDADDILDDVATETLQSALMDKVETGKRNKVRKFFFCSCFSSKNRPVLYRRDIAHKISDIRGRLDLIAKEKHDLHLEIRRDGGRRPQIEEVRRETSSLVNESDIIGRQVEKEKIIQLLVSSSSDDDELYSVIPIVGMGGLGKTTLSQFVYNDQRVKTHFGLRAWACVSDNFNVLRITNAIIESATGSNCGLSNLDAAQRLLQEKLNGEKFLIVLDDIWDENQNHWDSLRVPFGVGAKGSKIMVTTRSERVAIIVGTVGAHHLKVLPDGDCWELFSRRAFVTGISNAHPKLEDIGRQLVQKCEGLPLAIKTLGGILSSKTNVSEWEGILTSEIWKDDKNEILPALRLSYHYLPPNQKQCFAYCATFPKHFRFEKNVLVRQWMAVGFIQPKRSMILEDIGGEIFDDLLLKSFFQYSHHEFYRETSIYVMHDLMHDLAESISGDECLRMERGVSRTIPKIARHLSWILDEENPISLKVLYKFKSLRSFLVGVNSLNPPPIINDALAELTCLRVLDLSFTRIEKLPDSIGNLKHLRYLDLSFTMIDRLPESVTNLYNLQTLCMDFCVKLKGLPKGITNLVNLRYIAIRSVHLNWYSISFPGIGKLTSLQTLLKFKVCKESGCQIGELKDMRNIKGKIHISGLKNVQNIEEAKEANLKDKKYLDELVLEWDGDDNSEDGMVNDETVLEGLQPHTNLKNLQIFAYGGVSFPSWIGHLFNLTSITFEDCRKCERLLPLDIHLPSLRELTLRLCPKLEAFPEANPLPALTKLEIIGCEKLSTLPLLSSLCDLRLGRCGEKLLSSSVPCLTSLSILTIERFESLRSLPHGLLKPLTALQRLNIGWCDDLKYWSTEGWLQDLPSLQHLEIYSCHNLESLANGEGGLPTTLKTLEIHFCSNLKFMPTRLENLTSLKELIIEDCLQLHSLFPGDDNNDYGLPTALECLKILCCLNWRSDVEKKAAKIGPRYNTFPTLTSFNHRPGIGLESVRKVSLWNSQLEKASRMHVRLRNELLDYTQLLFLAIYNHHSRFHKRGRFTSIVTQGKAIRRPRDSHRITSAVKI
ncbi:putative disease resistance protein RGA3 isoform X2 [Tasmannia lanceolata]|uniref:putative disease resistance protein RGA3 isoform X2 n=1 Tax=Tasmannia lanceolata TaxID=3420 RepID=UPI004062AF1F